MAEGLLKQALLEANKTDCNVSSAGLAALVGHKADPSACQLMMKKGIGYFWAPSLSITYWNDT